MKKFHPLISISLSVLALVSLSSLRPSTVAAADCGGLVPTTPAKVSAVSGPSAGQVTLYWDTSAYAEHYGVVYGVESNKYLYGALNIGGEKARSSTINYLTPGKKYFFRLVGRRDCASSPFSAEVSAVARGGGVVVAPTTQVSAPAAVSVGAPTTVALTGVSGPVSKQKLTASSGPNVGEATLHWQHADNADNYHLVYGTAQGKYQYGALNIGKITSFTVQKLAPGTTYYFALVPVANGQALYTTSEVKAQAKAVYYVEVVETTKEALVQPPPPSALLTPAAGVPEAIVTIPPVGNPEVTTPPEENVVEPPAEELPVSPVN